MLRSKIFHTVDLHVEGEPLRVIVDGFPEFRGNTQLEKRAYAMKNWDRFRRLLMHEPRGHHGMYGCLITPPSRPTSDFGVLFMHNEGWSTMCGHGIIAVVSMGIETGKLQAEEGENKYRIDAPAGEIFAKAWVKDNQVQTVACEHVPSFVLAKDLSIVIEGRSLNVDLCFGGAFYVIIHSNTLGLTINKSTLPQMKRLANEIKKQVAAAVDVIHPLENGLKGIYGVIFLDSPEKEDSDLKNVTVFADQQVDRSPCGTGTAAVMAALFAHGRLKEGSKFVHESITGGQFVGEVLEEVMVGNYRGIRPSVGGRSFITGFHQFVVEKEDTLPCGFLLEEE